MKQLPPAPIPAAVAPVVHVAGPPSEGRGRLIVDVPEGPVPVYRVRLEPRPQDNGPRPRTFRFFELPPELLCKETPCVIDEPPGNILIGFPVLGCSDETEYDLVHVGLDPSVYRRSLSVFEDNTGAEQITGIALAGAGGAALITGIALLPAGAGRDSNNVLIGGAITLGAGALLTTIGVLLIRHDSATYRPGSANHFGSSTPTDGGRSLAPPRRSPLETIPSRECHWTTRRVGAG